MERSARQVRGVGEPGPGRGTAVCWAKVAVASLTGQLQVYDHGRDCKKPRWVPAHTGGNDMTMPGGAPPAM
jgi:hypothetical protein